jgi:translation initiation factor 5A
MAEELTTKITPEALKKPGFAMIQGMPCRISEINHKPKATANGNKRLHLVGHHIDTGKKYEDTLNLSAGFHGIDVPLTQKAAYTLLDVDASSGFLSLLTEGGDTKEDVGLSRAAEEEGGFDAIGRELLQRFEAGESLKVHVLTIMGKDIVENVVRDAD